MKKKLGLAILSVAMLSVTSCGTQINNAKGSTWDLKPLAEKYEDGTSSGSSTVELEKNGRNAKVASSFTEKSYTVTFQSTMGHELQKVITDRLVDGKYLPGFDGSVSGSPRIEVKLTTVGNYDALRESVITNIPTGGQPDLAFCYPDHIALYNQAGVVAHLDNFIESEEGFASSIASNFYVEGAAFGDGHMYSLPFAKSTEALYYNVDFFNSDEAKNAGITKVPTTWDEMWDTCGKILSIKPNSIPLGIDSESNLFIELAKQYGFGYTNTEGKFDFNNESAKTMIQGLANQYLTNGYFTTQTLYGSYTSSLFSSKTDEKCYMCIGSTGGAQYQYSADFETGVTLIPQAGEGGTNAVISQGPSVCMFEKGEQQNKATWELIKFLLSKDVQIAYAQQSGYIPALKAAQEDTTYVSKIDADAKLKTKAGVIAKAQKQSLAQMPYYFVSPAFVGSSTARTEVGSIITKVLGNQRTIDQAFEEAIAECEYAARAE
jgi:multiple sugar transport system substrate-binding protein